MADHRRFYYLLSQISPCRIITLAVFYFFVLFSRVLTPCLDYESIHNQWEMKIKEIKSTRVRNLTLTNFKESKKSLDVNKWWAQWGVDHSKKEDQIPGRACKYYNEIIKLRLKNQDALTQDSEEMAKLGSHKSVQDLFQKYVNQLSGIGPANHNHPAFSNILFLPDRENLLSVFIQVDLKEIEGLNLQNFTLNATQRYELGKLFKRKIENPPKQINIKDDSIIICPIDIGMIDFPSIEDSSVYHDNGWDNESDLEEFAAGLTKLMVNPEKKMDYRDISENTYTVMVLSKLFEPLFDNIICESPSSKKRKNLALKFVKVKFLTLVDLISLIFISHCNAADSKGTRENMAVNNSLGFLKTANIFSRFIGLKISLEDSKKYKPFEFEKFFFIYRGKE
ncbi:hypothetical protein G9A89_011475 [Geosiphon pyriformis]|nr:hypothetical protein G9A89_011475 [Geosiphon pyriformis]